MSFTAWKRLWNKLFLLQARRSGPKEKNRFSTCWVRSGREVVARRKTESLIQKQPFYAIIGSPVYENPLGALFAGRRRQNSGRRIRYSAALPALHHVALGR